MYTFTYHSSTIYACLIYFTEFLLQIIRTLLKNIMCPCHVVLVLLVLASLSAASPLQGSGYPHYDNMFQHQHEDTGELCTTLRRHMDVLLRSKTFRCERLPGEAPGMELCV